MDEILGQVRQHIESVIVHYRIPENLEKRFEWLSAGDSHVKQDLLSHLRHMEKSLVVEGARLQLPVMISHLKSAQGENTHRIAQVLKIGKHELEVSLERNFSGVALVEPSYRTTSNSASNGDYRWLWWIAGIALFIFFIAKK